MKRKEARGLRAAISGVSTRAHLSAQSEQKMSFPLVTKRLLDRLRQHFLQLKQYSCQEAPSWFTTLTPLPKPEGDEEGVEWRGRRWDTSAPKIDQQPRPPFPTLPTCDGALTAAALLGHAALVAFHAEDLVLVVGEAGACQRFGAGAADEAVAVPRLLLVAHPPRGDWLERSRETESVVDGRQSSKSSLFLS